jgi:hypothetical protein
MMQFEIFPDRGAVGKWQLYQRCHYRRHPGLTKFVIKDTIKDVLEHDCRTRREALAWMRMH